MEVKEDQILIFVNHLFIKNTSNTAHTLTHMKNIRHLEFKYITITIYLYNFKNKEERRCCI